MDAAAEIGRNSVSIRCSLSMEIRRLTRDGTAEPVSRDRIFRREGGQGNINVPYSADHEQDWQPLLEVTTEEAVVDELTTFISRQYYHCNVVKSSSW